MKPERYIDGSSEILSHILVLSLVDDGKASYTHTESCIVCAYRTALDTA